MNAGVGGHNLRHRYEELRRVALGKSAGVGQSRGWVLLVRRGMAAWMRAWLEVTPTPAKTVRQETQPSEGTAAAFAPELAVILATMALCNLEETTR
ncbi:MAG: hypothetical protein ACYTG0_41815 [Planctomycetota bacterium]|jgi:hypothetical protein